MYLTDRLGKNQLGVLASQPRPPRPTSLPESEFLIGSITSPSGTALPGDGATWGL